MTTTLYCPKCGSTVRPCSTMPNACLHCDYDGCGWCGPASDCDLPECHPCPGWGVFETGCNTEIERCDTCVQLAGDFSAAIAALVALRDDAVPESIAAQHTRHDIKCAVIATLAGGMVPREWVGTWMDTLHARLDEEPTLFTPCETLDSSSTQYTWGELLGLLAHHWYLEPGCVPRTVRLLNDGRVVDDEWDPATDPNPIVYARRTA